MPNAPARIARPSRIYVEGLHDAELIERVWGDDLRLEGLVVEPLHGADDLATVVRTFGPRSGRRLGVLLDHLIKGTKETRIAAEVNHPDVLITGHPFVDVWQCIKPSVIGVERWPVIEMGTDWKTGVCAELGIDAEPGVVWKQLLSNVNGYADLEHSFVPRVVLGPHIVHGFTFLVSDPRSSHRHPQPNSPAKCPDRGIRRRIDEVSILSRSIQRSPDLSTKPRHSRSTNGPEDGAASSSKS